MLHQETHFRKLKDAGFFLAFFGCLVFGANFANAGCSDYVLVNGKLLHEPAPVLPLPVSGLPAPKPCRGPGCSQQPLDVPPAPPVQQSIERLEIIAMDIGQRSENETVSYRSPVSVKSPLSVLISDIFRPPRGTCLTDG